MLKKKMVREATNESSSSEEKNESKSNADADYGAKPKTRRTPKKESDSDGEGDKSKTKTEMKPKEDVKESPGGTTSSYGDIPTEYLIDGIYNTVLNHKPKEWGLAQGVTLFVRTDDEKTAEIITNYQKTFSGKKHAEEILVDKLNRRKEQVINNNNPDGSEPDVKPSVVTVYQNNSPCSDCTGLLINYLEENKEVRLKLYVTSLYNIRRMSCKGEEHTDRVSESAHKANYNGLRNLMHHERCEIEAYSKETWETLLNIAPNLNKDEADKILENYKEVSGGHDRSRKDEDENIKNDLIHIQNNPLPDSE